jgi:hypothetical protein
VQQASMMAQVNIQCGCARHCKRLATHAQEITPLIVKLKFEYTVASSFGMIAIDHTPSKR